MSVEVELLNQDDKKALKHFMTGQIQNVLANEYGIGGKRRLQSVMDSAIQKAVLSDPFVERFVAVILRKQKMDFNKIITAAIEKASREIVTEHFKAAADRVKININVEPEAPAGMPENFGIF